jgi:hypothetical protein
VKDAVPEALFVAAAVLERVEAPLADDDDAPAP